MTKEEAKGFIARSVKSDIDMALVADAIKALEEESKSGWQHDHEILRAYSDGANEVLDKLRAEIEQLPTKTRINWDGCCPDIDYPEIEYVDITKKKFLDILDKYKGEVRTHEKCI